MTKRKKNDLVYKQFFRSYAEDWCSLETRTLAVAVKNKHSTGVGQNHARLTEEGKRQAMEIGARLKETLTVPDVVFFSGAPRTRETFECVVQGWPALASVREIYEDKRLREQEHGLLTVYTDKRVMFALHPEQKQLHDADGEYFYKYPNGENVPDTEFRVGLWLMEVGRKFAGKHVMIVGHFRAILALRVILEGLTPEDFIRIDSEDGPINCGVTVYRKDPFRAKRGKLVLQYYNKKLYD
jgi:broad specificity phosphatase PhoE